MTTKNRLFYREQYLENVARLSENYYFEKPEEKILTTMEYGRYIYTKKSAYKNRLIAINIYTGKQTIWNKDKDFAEFVGVSRPAISKAFYKETPISKDHFLYNVWEEVEPTIRKDAIYSPENMLRIGKLLGNIISRCIDHENYPTYIGCSYDESWEDIEKFAEDLKSVQGFQWWLDNPGQRIALDKDILEPGNTHYSFDRVAFVSNSENSKEAMNRTYGELNTEYNIRPNTKLANLIKMILSDNSEDLTYAETEAKYNVSTSVIIKAKAFLKANPTLTSDEFIKIFK